MAVLNKTIWASTVTDQLLANDSFLGTWTNYSQYVQGQKVIVPVQPDWKTNTSPIHVNPTSYNFLNTFNSSVYQANEISMDVLIAEPLTLSSPVEDYEYSFDKRANLLKYSSDLLKMTVSDLAIAKLASWTGVTTYATTGAKRAVRTLEQTGSRLGVSSDDLMKLRLLFNQQDVPLEGRNLLVPPELEADIMQLADFRPYYILTSNDDSLKTVGFLGKIYGFNVISRSRVLLTANGATTGTTGAVLTTNRIDSISGATQTGANIAILAYSDKLVGRAYSPVDIYTQTDSPYAYGTVVSYATRFSAFSLFTSAKGIAILAEATA